MTETTIDQFVDEQSAAFMATCPWFAIRKASRVATQITNHALKSTDMKITQLAVMAAIAQAEQGTVNELSEMLLTDQTTLSRNLKPLERDGWIAITPGKEDRRRRIVTLTELGKEVLAGALERWQEAEAIIRELLGEDYIATMFQVSQALSEVALDFED